RRRPRGQSDARRGVSQPVLVPLPRLPRVPGPGHPRPDDLHEPGRERRRGQALQLGAAAGCGEAVPDDPCVRGPGHGRELPGEVAPGLQHHHTPVCVTAPRQRHSAPAVAAPAVAEPSRPGTPTPSWCIARSRTRTCAQIATSVAGPAHRTANAGNRPWQTRCAETTFVIASRRRRETMTPNRRTTRMPRLLTAAAGTALALSLSGCGLLGGGDEPAEGPESEAAQPSEGASDAGTDSSDEGSMTQTTPSESATADPAEAEPTDTASTDLFADAA